MVQSVVLPVAYPGHNRGIYLQEVQLHKELQSIQKGLDCRIYILGSGNIIVPVLLAFDAQITKRKV